MNQANSQKELIRGILKVIALCELDKESIRDTSGVGYINQRTLISSLFQNGRYDISQIMLRLTVIDSLYSTNAAYSYFSFDEMANKILALGENAKDARKYFYQVALTGDDPAKLFCEPYGIQKNLSEGSKQMSLLSKYAYYEVAQDPKNCPIGFPIYDSLAKEAYPLVRKMLGEKNYYSMSQSDNISIKQYVTCLTQLRKVIFDDNELFRPSKSSKGYQQFDILDAYLWRMGKFTNGNMSLLMGREDYKKFICNLQLDSPKYKDDNEKKEKEATYEEKMTELYKAMYPADKEQEKEDNKKYDFNRMILYHFTNDNNPFAGLKNESYLNALLQHWKVFYSYKKISPTRGISFP